MSHIGGDRTYSKPEATTIVMVAIVTSLMAPPLLRWTLSKVTIGSEEAHRLKQEELSIRRSSGAGSSLCYAGGQVSFTCV